MKLANFFATGCTALLLAACAPTTADVRGRQPVATFMLAGQYEEIGTCLADRLEAVHNFNIQGRDIKRQKLYRITGSFTHYPSVKSALYDVTLRQTKPKLVAVEIRERFTVRPGIYGDTIAKHAKKCEG